MHKSIISFIAILTIIQSFNSCRISKLNTNNDFEIIDSYYQSWQVNENEKGTNITIEVKNIKDGISFDSIVFQNFKVPITFENKNNIILLQAIVEKSISRFNTKSEPSTLPDQLIYRLNGIRYIILLTNISRKEMKYYK